MADLRAKRIRAGAIIVLVSIVAMLVLAGFGEYELWPSGENRIELYEPSSVFDGFSQYQVRLWQTGADTTRAAIYRRGTPPVTIYPRYAYLRYSWVFAFGMTGVTIGAILLIVGLTTKAGIP